MNKKFYHIYIGIMAIIMAACQNEGILPLEDELGSVSYTIKLEDNIQGRALSIGNGDYVDQLVVGVFQTQDYTPTQISQFTYPVVNGMAMINIPLLKKETYDLVFWAQTEDNDVYNIEDLNSITVDYSTFKKKQTESITLDAFYAVQKNVSVAAPGDASIPLCRPFAQVSFGVYGNQEDVDRIKAAEIKISGLYTKFCPLNETVEEMASEPYVFRFTELMDKGNTFSINDKVFTHLTTNYFLAPIQDADYKISGSGKFMDENDAIVSEFTFADAPLLPNERVNVGKIMDVD